MNNFEKPVTPKWSRMASLRRYFINGLLFVLPIGLTLWFLVYLVSSVDEILRNLLSVFVSDTSPVGLLLSTNYVFGLSILVTVILLIVIGWLVRNVFGKMVRTSVDRLFEAVPLVNRIYHFVKQVTTSIGKGGGSAFKRVVLVDYPHPGTKAVGFVSNENLAGVMGKDACSGKIAVFVPTSPNPTSGFVIVVNVSDSIPVDMTVEQGLQFIISGGTLEIIKEDPDVECDDPGEKD